jgi:hypothetical protein
VEYVSGRMFHMILRRICDDSVPNAHAPISDKCGYKRGNFYEEADVFSINSLSKT